MEWFRNEKPIEDSSRITKQHDFGYVSMDISHIRDDDDGVYMCRATNPLGEAVTTASMRVRTKASIQLESQHPESIRRLQQLEQLPMTRPDAPERLFEKPIFTQLLTGPAELWEGQHAHFEARVVPVGGKCIFLLLRSLKTFCLNFYSKYFRIKDRAKCFKYLLIIWPKTELTEIPNFE